MKKMFISRAGIEAMRPASPLGPPWKGLKAWRRMAAVLAIALGCVGCAFTDMGQRVNAERERVQELEKRRAELESRLVIVMNNLEMHPEDDKLSRERDQVKAKLRSVEEKLSGSRQMFDQILKEWDEKIVQERIQQQMIEKEVRDNARKDEYEWDDKEQGKN